jgi:hypothetical protein
MMRMKDKKGNYRPEERTIIYLEDDLLLVGLDIRPKA